MKRRASTGSSFGFGGRGVSHGIRKPKTKATPPPMKKTKLPLMKPVAPKFTTTLQPEREGKLSPSVNYVVKNGQYHFLKSRRSSPRKALSPAKASSPFTPSHVRKTPKLFTPSSNG